jgi:hypothetical protein
MQESLRPADLTAFLRALELGAVPEGGFGVTADDIALVESAWQSPGAVVLAYGWVLALKNGRRLHLEYTRQGAQCGAPEELEIATLRPEQSCPALDDDAAVCWYRPSHLNVHLGITPPSLH